VTWSNLPWVRLNHMTSPASQATTASIAAGVAACATAGAAALAGLTSAAAPSEPTSAAVQIPTPPVKTAATLVEATVAAMATVSELKPVAPEAAAPGGVPFRPAASGAPAAATDGSEGVPARPGAPGAPAAESGSSLAICPVTRWENAVTCGVCHVAFSYMFFTPRHHCRLCGKSFCFEHAKEFAVVPGAGDSPVRLCNNCAKQVRSTAASAPSAPAHGTPAPTTDAATTAATATRAAVPAVVAALGDRQTSRVADAAASNASCDAPSPSPPPPPPPTTATQPQAATAALSAGSSPPPPPPPPPPEPLPSQAQPTALSPAPSASKPSLPPTRPQIAVSAAAPQPLTAVSAAALAAPSSGPQACAQPLTAVITSPAASACFSQSQTQPPTPAPPQSPTTPLPPPSTKPGRLLKPAAVPATAEACGAEASVDGSASGAHTAVVALRETSVVRRVLSNRWSVATQTSPVASRATALATPNHGNSAEMLPVATSAPKPAAPVFYREDGPDASAPRLPPLRYPYYPYGLIPTDRAHYSPSTALVGATAKGASATRSASVGATPSRFVVDLRLLTWAGRPRDSGLDEEWEVLSTNLNPAGQRNSFLAYRVSSEEHLAVRDISVIVLEKGEKTADRLPRNYTLLDHDLNLGAPNAAPPTFLCFTRSDKCGKPIMQIQSIVVDGRPFMIPTGFQLVRGDHGGNCNLHSKSHIYLAVSHSPPLC
jgi:hypothetical protein